MAHSAYPLASLGHAAWILRHYSYRAVFIWGLCLYGIGALLCIPAILHRSFAGFCVCIFIMCVTYRIAPFFFLEFLIESRDTPTLSQAGSTKTDKLYPNMLRNYCLFPFEKILTLLLAVAMDWGR